MEYELVAPLVGHSAFALSTNREALMSRRSPSSVHMSRSVACGHVRMCVCDVILFYCHLHVSKPGGIRRGTHRNKLTRCNAVSGSAWRLHKEIAHSLRRILGSRFVVAFRLPYVDAGRKVAVL